MASKLAEVGRRNRRVTVVVPGTGTRGPHNAPVAGTPVLREKWAAVTPAPGTERFESAERAAAAPMRFLFGWEAGPIDETWSLLFEGHSFEIASVTEVGFREGWEVLATARAEETP